MMCAGAAVRVRMNDEAAAAEACLVCAVLVYCPPFQVKEYDFVANGDNLLPVEDDMEWFQRVMQSFASSLGYSEEER